MKSLYLFLFLISLTAHAHSKPDSLKRIISTFPKSGNTSDTDTIRIRLLCELGNETPDPTEARAYLKEALELSQSINWKKGTALVNNVEGRLLVQDNFYYQAIDKFNEAIKIGEATSDRRIIRRAYMYLGAAYYALGDDTMAITYYKKALNGLQEESLRQYCTTRNNIGLCYIRMKRYKEAEELFQNVINLYKPTNDSLPLSWFYSNLGIAQRGQSLFEESIRSFDLSLAHTPPVPTHGLAFTTSEKALSLYKSGKIDQAVKLATQARVWGENTSNFKKTYILENLYIILKAKGDTKNALAAYEDWMRLRSQNDEDMKKKSIEGLKMYYENQQKEAEIMQAKTRNQYMTYGLSGLLLVSVLIFRNYYIVRGNNRKIELQKVEISKMNLELEDLNSNLESKVIARTEELNEANKELVRKNFEITEALFKGQSMERKRVAAELHDNLGSTLTALKWRLDALNDEVLNPRERTIYKSIKETMSNAYHEVRNISQNLAPKDLEEYGLIGALQHFITSLNSHQKIAFKIISKSEHYEISQSLEFEIFTMVKELITNTLKHSKASEVAIVFGKAEDNFLSVQVESNAEPVKVQSYDRYSQGINNLKERIKTLNGQLNIEDLSNIRFTIPM